MLSTSHFHLSKYFIMLLKMKEGSFQHVVQYFSFLFSLLSRSDAKCIKGEYDWCWYSKAIPESPEHLASYEEVILRTEEFHEYIVTIRYITFCKSIPPTGLKPLQFTVLRIAWPIVLMVKIFSRLLSPTNHTILNYAKNVDAIYASKVCERLLTEAREIMKKDLYVAEEVTEKGWKS